MNAPGARGSRSADYEFILPAGRIAQSPAARRDASRLMVLDRSSGAIAHRAFAEIESVIAPGDALVVNTTRVMRARLLGRRDSGAPGEVLLLRALDGDRWEAMVHPGAKLKPGRVLHIAPGFDVEIAEVTERGTRIVHLRAEEGALAAIERHGHVPLPPYIARPDGAADAERYQTVYSRELGSVAAPTAGLHFTPELLARLEARGVRRVEVLLHVGAGTFKPVEVEDPGEHVMHEEPYEVSEHAARAIAEVRSSGGSVWAVGTTSARVLESAAAAGRVVTAGRGDTRLFIRPGYEFRVVDKLLTNFHLPRSTLLMLVAAMAGYDLTMKAYAAALEEGYRFYSYGDAMVVI